ncbi:helix-turn-helix domain-containing protein [Kutzneria kofuensis]|uniref:Putative site-specific integrase-resolvase n=1 Tax=Kutzneria kofuensis TaxID=103725 RepID=A0A7W9KBX1_9PSEU|nr:helix-turn-helix domain-containing protein [Kutzneria kofuensis]MBB5889681.1 putative site-specific integrase-resolvase [Kutzneria kofuensis]
MRTSMPKQTYYSVRQAAWLLGIDPSTASRAVRLGSLRTVRRRGRLVVPATAVARLLSEPSGGVS